MVKGLLPGRYASREEALREVCDKYVNLPGAHIPIKRGIDPVTHGSLFRSIGTEYCGATVLTGVNEYGASTITIETVQGPGLEKNCTYPDFVLLADDNSRHYQRDTLIHNHTGGTPISEGDCGAIKMAAEFEASLPAGQGNLSITLAAFIGRAGKNGVECAGWYELTVPHSKSYAGRHANSLYYDVARDGYAPSLTFNLETCQAL